MNARTTLAISLLATVRLAAQAPAPVRLVRCDARTDAACLRTRLELPVGSGSSAAIDSTAEARAWRATLGGSRLISPGVSIVVPPSTPATYLVLVDLGQSMSGEGIAFARAALESWIGTLGSATKIAVAGFDSRDVSLVIDSAVFGTPAQALQQVDRFPAPDLMRGSALYSAAALGAERLRAVAGHDADHRAALVLLTAGRNESGRVREKNAPTILDGPDGLAAAAATVAASGQAVSLILLAPDTTAALHTLVGPRGAIRVTARDPNAITAQLASLSRGLARERQLTFVLDGANPAPLARTALLGTVRLAHGDAVITNRIVWRPPLMASPVYRGVADSLALAAPVRDALLIGPATGSSRPLIFILVGLIIGSIAVLVPRYEWAESVVPERARTEHSTMTRGAVEAVAPADPRGTEDITHQTARRTAMHR